MLQIQSEPSVGLITNDRPAMLWLPNSVRSAAWNVAPKFPSPRSTSWRSAGRPATWFRLVRVQLLKSLFTRFPQPRSKISPTLANVQTRGVPDAVDSRTGKL